MARRLKLLIITAFVTVATAIAGAAQAGPPKGYTFKVVATLGGQAPPGDNPHSIYFGDFEPQDINSRGDLAFASDVTKDGTNVVGEALYGRYRGTTLSLLFSPVVAVAVVGLRWPPIVRQPERSSS